MNSLISLQLKNKNLFNMENEGRKKVPNDNDLKVFPTKFEKHFC